MSDTNLSRAASGRFLLRISPGLHEALRRAAHDAGASLNDYCAHKLAAPGTGAIALPGAAASVARAAELFGGSLLGVAVFGSWVRGEAAAGSDVDVLVVVERSVPLVRRLYRAWDEREVFWDGRSVEPHFVHPPDLRRTAAGIWAEVALDGIVLFERGLSLSTHLARVRHDIATGRVVRREAHGQPYWVQAV